MSDPGIVAAYRRALARRGQPVLVRRVSGDAPNVATFDAAVTAVVMDYAPQGDVLAVKPEGGITQGDRLVILLTDDLAALQWPLPVQKNDKIVLLDDVGNEVESLNVTKPDPYKRALGGAIELRAEGV